MAACDETKRVIKMEHSEYIIHDSGSQRDYHTDQGLAFAIGVAVMECELARDYTRFWQVQHPNGVNIYHVAHISSGPVVVTRIGG